ncbi:MAG: [acyl-carrier-protein] S-malonyltransferase [Oceanospirillaceae bacterium]|nr:[acyl-carrier-protein] S-malonyltransferase [Oceanospirillaceae bacterium]|tara:strand:+ start:11750 stop:12694 length:945 start_codon:yes stop_codon:yes gene_type:complete
MTNIIAFFPGQGAQQVGMLADIAAAFPQVQNTFAEASDALGFDLWAMVLNGPDADLNQTFNTQPALLAASTALWRILVAEAPALQVAAAAGHSLGEYSALVAADSIDFADAIRLVRRRGELMEAAVPGGLGGMAAVLGLDNEQIAQVCADAASAGVVEPANFNAPGQIVIAGEKVAIDKAIELAKAAGAKRALPLAVSGPFHSSLMKPAAESFREDLLAVKWRAPAFPVYHNAGNAPATLETVTGRLEAQLYSPVDWSGAVEAVRPLADQGVEIGPGKVVSGLNKRIDKTLPVASTGDLAGLKATIDLIQGVSA